MADTKLSAAETEMAKRNRKGLCAACGKPPCADGKMHFRDKFWVCSMDQRTSVRDVAKSTFPFTTTHLSGSPITVTSLRHLRQLENRHGVQSHAYNMNQPERRER